MFCNAPILLLRALYVEKRGKKIRKEHASFRKIARFLNEDRRPQFEDLITKTPTLVVLKSQKLRHFYVSPYMKSFWTITSNPPPKRPAKQPIRRTFLCTKTRIFPFNLIDEIEEYIKKNYNRKQQISNHETTTNEP